jgi:hypothetical protein
VLPVIFLGRHYLRIFTSFELVALVHPPFAITGTSLLGNPNEA